MPASAAAIASAVMLAALLGFAAHWAGICTVKAVEEVMTTRRGFMLASFGKCAFWVIATTTALIWLVPDRALSQEGWRISGGALAGGFIFGVGATINGGCAFSTLTRLGDGRLAMAMTLVGFAAGAAGLAVWTGGGDHLPAPPLFDLASRWALVLLAVLALCMAWEIVRLVRTALPGASLAHRVAARRYRLSTAALLIGVSNGILYVLIGPWAYSGTIAAAGRAAAGQAAPPGSILWALLVAALVGVVLSSWQGGSFRLEWRPRITWLYHLAGGVLMGFGAALTPGGNDVLLLHHIPGFSPHALPAFAAMIAGIAMALGAHRLMGIDIPVTSCSGDLCSR